MVSTKSFAARMLLDALIMRSLADALTMCATKSNAARKQWSGCAYHARDKKHCCAHAVERMWLPRSSRKAMLRARSGGDVLTMCVTKALLRARS